MNSSKLTFVLPRSQHSSVALPKTVTLHISKVTVEESGEECITPLLLSTGISSNVSNICPISILSEKTTVRIPFRDVPCIVYHAACLKLLQNQH